MSQGRVKEKTTFYHVKVNLEAYTPQVYTETSREDRRKHALRDAKKACDEIKQDLEKQFPDKKFIVTSDDIEIIQYEE